MSFLCYISSKTKWSETEKKCARVWRVIDSNSERNERIIIHINFSMRPFTIWRMWRMLYIVCGLTFCSFYLGFGCHQSSDDFFEFHSFVGFDRCRLLLSLFFSQVFFYKKKKKTDLQVASVRMDVWARRIDYVYIVTIAVHAIGRDVWKHQ